MDSRTLTALRASIGHWAENEHAMRWPDAKLGIDHCALCTEFYNSPDDEQDCKDCPIAQFTGFVFCESTPYNDAASAHANWEYLRLNSTAHPFIAEWRAREAFHLAARDERQFLESLLPQEPSHDEPVP